LTLVLSTTCSKRAILPSVTVYQCTKRARNGLPVSLHVPEHQPRAANLVPVGDYQAGCCRVAVPFGAEPHEHVCQDCLGAYVRSGVREASGLSPPGWLMKGSVLPGTTRVNTLPARYAAGRSGSTPAYGRPRPDHERRKADDLGLAVLSGVLDDALRPRQRRARPGPGRQDQPRCRCHRSAAPSLVRGPRRT
jgi:hypothetical protein